MKFSLLLFYSLSFTSLAQAGLTTFAYKLGVIAVTEKEHQILLDAQIPISLAILPGGKTWPHLALDEKGRVYAGSTVIDAKNGHVVSMSKATLELPHDVQVTAIRSTYNFQYAGKICALTLQNLGLDKRRSALDTLKSANLKFSSADKTLLALATQFSPDGKVAAYLVEKIDLDRCQVTILKKMDNLDLLIELNHSDDGGWWITGTIEQTLLRSVNGAQWRAISLPKDLSSLLSSYIVNDHEIWLAAILPSDDEPSPFSLVYSNDGGQHWRNIAADDPVLAKLPEGWLEG